MNATETLRYDPRTYRPLIDFPYQEAADKRRAMTKTIKDEIRTGETVVPGDVVLDGTLEKWIAELAAERVDPLFKAERDAYDAAHKEGMEAYNRDMEEALKDLPPAIASFVSWYCYDHGHSSGYAEVLNMTRGMVGDLLPKLKPLLELADPVPVGQEHPFQPTTVKHHNSTVMISSLRKSLGYDEHGHRPKAEEKK